MQRIPVFLCLALLLSTVAIAQQADRATANGLGGVETVYLVVHVLDEDLISDGLETEAVWTEIKTLLQDGGLVVAELKDVPEPAEIQGTIRLAIDATIAATANRVYDIRLELRQRVSLTRDPETQLAATTWSAGDFGMSTRKDMLEIRSATRDLVGQFLADHRTANPKPKK